MTTQTDLLRAALNGIDAFAANGYASIAALLGNTLGGRPYDVAEQVAKCLDLTAHARTERWGRDDETAANLIAVGDEIREALAQWANAGSGSAQKGLLT